MNPARGKRTSYRPARVTVGLITYIPHWMAIFRKD